MKEFNVKKVKDEVVEWIRDFFKENGDGCNAIVGISGGKDSSVVAALCVEALGVDRVIGVLMPNGVQSDIDYSKDLVEFLGIKNYIVNIGSTTSELFAEISAGLGFVALTSQTRTNLPARIRMTTLYAISQSNNGRVANTCNLSEDWVGYATRYGDAAGDFSPLSHLTVTEVRAIGRELGIPAKFIEKVPTDGLCGLTDEENLGFTYDELDRYLRTGEIDDATTGQKIDQMYAKNKFKLELMPAFEYIPECCGCKDCKCNK